MRDCAMVLQEELLLPGPLVSRPPTSTKITVYQTLLHLHI